ncbi:hypothetical protein RD110_09645 [Rhodoferax koreense]|uniref:Protein NO VEIN C-terminal domain-containing protein n=1 Tax=Rhodoferax koreensis TaxID=1842727 RepID=A0A1P8JUK7_9BURK|nr:DUF3883 domain-containing protein [Rhodoferax koreense]APW37418.1 hypothetical protein RD110_09645 [Rhodoferax koreense]
MESEVNPQVLAVLNEERLSGPRLSPVDIVAKMGVFDAREKAYDHAWLATGDIVIATVWAERVSLGDGGRWFCLDSLDTQQRPDGRPRAPNQVQKAIDRLALLKRTLKEERGFRAVLQTNRVAIADVESDKNAKVSTRVRDPEEWHVAAWDAEQQFAVLVRGPRGFVPSDAQVQEARARCGIPEPVAPDPNASRIFSPEELQAAAMAYVTKHFAGYGYKPEDVRSQNLGYDIEVTNAKGAKLLRVAVKGTTPKGPNFSLSQQELKCSTREPLWKLLVVTDVTGPAAAHKIYKPTEVEQAEGYTAA